jgi:SagB-type dehydrogenase family enzyme
MNLNSLLTTLRPNFTGATPLVEIIDPEKNTVDPINPENLLSMAKTAEVIQSIKQRLDHASPKNTHYTHWQDKGWYKSIDYYAASRANDFDTENQIRAISHKAHDSDNIFENQSETLCSIPQALLRRRTKRVFKKCTLDEGIFHAGIKNVVLNNLTEATGYELYCIIYKVDKLVPGVYIFNVKQHALKLIREGIFLEEMSANIQGMNTPKSANFTIILVANFERLLKTMPYPRGLRDTYIETGRLAQKLLIAYMQFGVFGLVTPALKDRNVAALLDLKEPQFSPLYSLTFGYPIK